jgi:hypothetical protein
LSYPVAETRVKLLQEIRYVSLLLRCQLIPEILDLGIDPVRLVRSYYLRRLEEVSK